MKELGRLNETIKNTYEHIKNKSMEGVISEHKNYLKHKFKIEINDNKNKLPAMYWIPKIHKYPVSFKFIIASPCCTLKSLSKDIFNAFKLFYQKTEIYQNKGRLWYGINKFWVIQNNKPVIKTLRNINKHKSGNIFLPLISQHYALISTQ